MNTALAGFNFISQTVNSEKPKIAVVIPCYRVKNQIGQVLDGITTDVWRVYLVDDCCPDQSLSEIKKTQNLKIIKNRVNLGVGGATIRGYLEALRDGADIVVKLDGDGQMDPKLLPNLVYPIILGTADYVKGNRFYEHDSLEDMPLVRLIGNCALSFISKCSSGYWNIMDPTNGYTAIHRDALSKLPLNKINPRYFFESEMLFRLYIIRAVVAEMPMRASYGEEQSNLNVIKVLKEFPNLHLKCFFKRIIYSYFIRDFNLCSFQLILGISFTTFGLIFGVTNWLLYGLSDTPTPLGTIALAALPFIMGFQLLLNAINLDVQNIPNKPISNHTNFSVITPK